MLENAGKIVGWCVSGLCALTLGLGVYAYQSDKKAAQGERAEIRSAMEAMRVELRNEISAASQTQWSQQMSVNNTIRDDHSNMRQELKDNAAEDRKREIMLRDLVKDSQKLSEIVNELFIRVIPARP